MGWNCQLLLRPSQGAQCRKGRKVAWLASLRPSYRSSRTGCHRGQGRRGTCAEEEPQRGHMYASEVNFLERLGSTHRATSIFMPFGPQDASFLEIYLKETIQMPNAQTFHYDM